MQRIVGKNNPIGIRPQKPGDGVGSPWPRRSVWKFDKQAGFMKYNEYTFPSSSPANSTVVELLEFKEGCF